MKFPVAHRSINRLKQDAKLLKKSNNISHLQALNIIARNNGYNNWIHLLKIERLQKNLAILNELKLDYGILQITQTGIDKSIMDATAPLRSYLKYKKFHDFSMQRQGSENKVLQSASIFVNNSAIKTKVSLYRPKTKNGDPRIWVYDLKKHVKADDYLLFIVVDKILHVFNLHRINLKDHVPLLQFIKEREISIAKELFKKLQTVASHGALEAVCTGDTAVGRTIETALGIDINSSKKPDYKGIEIKSFRKRKKSNRKNLFAQVPNWKESNLKSSGEIVDKYGYERDGDLRLYCTLSTETINSQNLSLEVDLQLDMVKEVSISNGVKTDVVTWNGEKLRGRLLEKHKETFWVEVDSVKKEGKEYFTLKSIHYTKSPLLGRLMSLLASGDITIDHLIKRKNITESAKEKGPIFKIKPEKVNLLFDEDENFHF